MQRTLTSFAIVWLVAMALVASLVGCGDGDKGSGGTTGDLLTDGGGTGDDLTETGGDSGDSDDSGEAEDGIAGYKIITVENGGSVTGAITFDGDGPEAYEYKAGADAEVCAGGGMGEGKRKNIRLQLGDRDGGKKGVAHVVVRIHVEKGAGLPDSASAEIDNQNCEFTPLVQVIPHSAKIAIKNSDDTTHNTKGLMQPRDGDQYEAFNPNLTAGKSSDYTDGFENPGVVTLTCDQHYWMQGYIIVQEHPYYAVTDEKGNFEIKNLPAGKYKVTFWHANYKLRMKDGKMSGYENPVTWTGEVEVKAGEATDMGEVAYKK